MESKQSNSFRLLLVFLLTVPLSAVTVNPSLCPTNKIAPHRRTNYQQRTFGAFYDLLGSGGYGNQPYNPNLQEQSFKDELDDCGDIEDYDENDLSSLTPTYLRRQGYSDTDSRFFFGLFNGNNRPPQQPQQPQYPPQAQNPQQPQHPPQPQNPQQPQYPSRPPQRPPPPTRPPYASGGVFGNQPYRPPVHHYPSADIKPVHDAENHPEPQTTYRPHIVGGPIGHVVGVTPVAVRPYKRPILDPTTQSPYVHYPTRPTQHPGYQYTTRRPRKLNNNNNDSIFGSFFDLLFK